MNEPISEFDEPFEDDIEMSDQFNRLQGMPPQQQQQQQQQQQPPPAVVPSTQDFRPQAAKVEPGKVRFQIVEGEFWEKGKRRGRADKDKRQ